MALCLQRIQRSFCVPMAHFVLWIYNLHRWQLYDSHLVHHFIDVCLEGLDYAPQASSFWWMASLLHNAYPRPELRLRITRRMLDIGGVAKEQRIVRRALNRLCQLEPVYQCIDRHFLAEFVRVMIMTSDEALLGKCLSKIKDMADVVLADDLSCLVAFRRHVCRALLKPDMLSEVRHLLLELLAGWPAFGCTKRFRLGHHGGLRWGTSSCWGVGLVLHTSETLHPRECKRRTREKEAPLNCVLPLKSVWEGCRL